MKLAVGDGPDQDGPHVRSRSIRCLETKQRCYRWFFLFGLQVRVSGDVTTTQLLQLIPNTQYVIRILALHGESTSEPLEGQGVTCKCCWTNEFTSLCFILIN